MGLGEVEFYSPDAPVYFAFRYTGSGKSTYDGTFEVDDIRVYDKAME